MQQRLLWSMGRPICYLGATIDEWVIIVLGVVPGVMFLTSERLLLSLISVVSSILLLLAFKKYKKLSVNFNLKSFLVAKKLIKAPESYPGLLKKKVGR